MTESVHLSTAGTGAEYVAPDATVTVKVGSEHTGAQYEIFEIDAPRGPAAPPHSESWSKAFYVLQGRILVQAGDQGYDLGPGASISIPAGTLNTFSVLTPSAKFLAVSQTGGWALLRRPAPPTRPTTPPWGDLGPARSRMRHEYGGAGAGRASSRRCWSMVWVMESFLYRHPRLYPLFLTKPARLRRGPAVDREPRASTT